MKWQEQLPKWHPLHKEEDVTISPGTERALHRISEHMPDLLRELKRLNDNLEMLGEKLPSVKGIGASMSAVVKKVKDDLTST